MRDLSGNATYQSLAASGEETSVGRNQVRRLLLFISARERSDGFRWPGVLGDGKLNP
jgi:hypothetical protein